ncbi:MAG: adenine deaminase [Bacteroidetes bacterium]|nr:MAG: adenine deaminase [Bacteroidota bacterium]
MKEFEISGTIVDVVNKCFYKGVVRVCDAKIVDVVKRDDVEDQLILPGLIDSHIHIESSMLVPSEFAKAAVLHGTVATVSDPHEIANVLGIEGINFMIDNSKTVPFKFYFGAPSCVPATGFETSGFELNSEKIKNLLKSEDIYYLAEMMNFPGVIYSDKEVVDKINLSKKFNKPVDGHAPGLCGNDLKKYADAGISTDHECSTIEEALEKINCGMQIQIREGSAAKNFEVLCQLIDSHPDKVMLCSDDLHPDNLIEGHINKLIKKAQKKGFEFFNILRAATYNPVKHYGLNVGLLQKNDPADFIVVDGLDNFNVLKTYINGDLVAENKKALFKTDLCKPINNFTVENISKSDLIVSADNEKQMNVINAFDGELFTKRISVKPKTENNCVVTDIENDILKIVVVNRYAKNAKPIVGFIKGFGLKKGAIASSIAHDSHNIICVGTNDTDILNAIMKIIDNKGGIVAINSDDVSDLSLPIAGLMSNKPAREVAKQYLYINNKAIEFGSRFSAPFMTLAFMALLVIPEIKIGDKGLFDVNKFQFISLFK